MKPEPPKPFAFFTQDPLECPFREFRDSELGTDYWGMGPAAFRTTMLNKSVSKHQSDHVWEDDQTQPLPRSVRNYLHGWIRAEELAMNRWEAELVVFEDVGSGHMSMTDTQLSHAQVLSRSSFCRNVLSACYMLEKSELYTVEHTWEGFSCAFGPEGWRARYHIYSPGLKSGGGAQHRPTLSKTGCYLVRLYYLGAWRCVWVSDQVPVDATEAPLLPFSPLLTHAPAPVKPGKNLDLVQSGVVHLWPLLVCKAILKLSAPDMNADEEFEISDGIEHHIVVEDEYMPEMNILHALTGSMNLRYFLAGQENTWNLLLSEVQVFGWDDDEETITSTVKSKSTKQKSTKENAFVKRSLVSGVLIDTRNEPPYMLPGITPAHEMSVLVTMVRDVPLKKPLPAPDVALWKTYRWVDWARHHGLYDAYDCPRTKYLKLSGLLKMSAAPHLLDVQSTDSITCGFKEEQQEKVKKSVKEINKSSTNLSHLLRDELREWVLFHIVYSLLEFIDVLSYPSLYQFTSTADSPPIRISTKAPLNRALDIPAPKQTPLYLQIDSGDENKLKLSLHTIHPRVLMNSGVHLEDYVEPSYFILEVFEWFKDVALPKAKAFVQTRGYHSVEISFVPGRHFCRIWVHSRMHWHLAILSDSNMVLGSRETILCASVHECPWASKFLSNLGTNFSNWIRMTKSTLHISTNDKEFFESYQPDLHWDPDVVGYKKCFVHWMFRQALQNYLAKRLSDQEYQNVCVILRKYFLDPEFGLPAKPKPGKSVREIADKDPCDCQMPEEIDMMEETQEEQTANAGEQGKEEEKPLVSPEIMAKLLTEPRPPVQSQVCEFATEEVSCAILKGEREKMIRKHEAAIFIQANWRGTWARKCLSNSVIPSSEVIKLLLDTAFGNLESLTALMKEFFVLYPGAKYAYSVASALSGLYGLQQHFGSAPVAPKFKWIPYFQGVFYCHEPVKVHFDLQSSLNNTIVVYSNDSGKQLPQAYSAHVTFDIKPNVHGYTVIGHGTAKEPFANTTEIHWQLTILASIDLAFHICDNDPDVCNILPMSPTQKLRLEEIYIPNKQCVLGGIVITVSRNDAVSFRATATTPDLEMEAVLKTTNEMGYIEEVARCSGKGEICWTYLQLRSVPVGQQAGRKKSISHANLFGTKESSSARASKKRPTNAGVKSRSTTKLKDLRSIPPDVKQYVIEVVAPKGWPLTLEQWQRVDVIRNSLEPIKVEIPKKGAKEKTGSAKDKKEPESKLPGIVVQSPQLGDAYTVLSCATTTNGGTIAKRDDERDLAFAAARLSWEAKEPGRNVKGDTIRRTFREEYLVPLPMPSVKTETTLSLMEEGFATDFNTPEQSAKPGPSPVTSCAVLEEILEEEEEAKYLTMPDQLRDKFIPFDFVETSTKEKSDEEAVLLTADRAEAAKKERHARIEGALDRMHDLKQYNTIHVLGRQIKRCKLLEKVGIDEQFSPEMHQVLGERDEAIAKEALERSQSASRKKLEAKVAKGGK